MAPKNYCHKREYCKNYKPKTGCNSHQESFFKCDFFERMVKDSIIGECFVCGYSVTKSDISTVNHLNCIQASKVQVEKTEKLLEFLESIGISNFVVKKDGTFKFKVQVNDADKVKGHLHIIK